MKTPALTIMTFLFEKPRQWQRTGRASYDHRHVNALYRMCLANIRIPFRFVCLTDTPDGIECETRPCLPAIFVNGEDACYRRLQAFAPEFEAEIGSDFLCWLDLDAVFTRDATAIFQSAMQHDFTTMEGSVWQKDGTACCHYNGSFVLWRAGTHNFLWSDFNPDTFYDQREAYKMPNGRRPLGSDQAWFSVRLGPDANKIGVADGVAQQRAVKTSDDPAIYFFAGRNDPWSREVQVERPDLYALWQCYASDKVLPASGKAGRAMVLMTGSDVWTDAQQAMEAGVSGVIAHPHAALQWPNPVDGVALDTRRACELAEALGFDETAICGAYSAAA